MPKKSADSEAVVTRQSSRKRKVPDRYEEYVSNRAAPDSPDRSRSNSPVSRKNSRSKKKQESESEDEVPSDESDEEVEDESEVEESEESEASDSENDKKKKSRGRGSSKSKGSNGKSSKSKGSSSSKSFVSKLDESVRDELEDLNVDQLKERLRDNDQVTTGSKGELQERIAECITDGCLPRCPKCALGKVKKDSKGYYCPGGYDDDKYKRCSWKSKNIDRPRWKPAAGNLV